MGKCLQQDFRNQSRVRPVLPALAQAFTLPSLTKTDRNPHGRVFLGPCASRMFVHFGRIASCGPSAGEICRRAHVFSSWRSISFWSPTRKKIYLDGFSFRTGQRAWKPLPAVQSPPPIASIEIDVTIRNRGWGRVTIKKNCCPQL